MFTSENGEVGSNCEGSGKLGRARRQCFVDTVGRAICAVGVTIYSLRLNCRCQPDKGREQQNHADSLAETGDKPCMVNGFNPRHREGH
jgi:hypothetical protein